MRILFTSKRHPQQRDVVERPYGRFFHLPRLFAGRGHEVLLLLSSHRRLDSTRFERDGLRWVSHDVRTLGPARFLPRMREEAMGFAPDWIVGCSDAWFGWMARRLARATGARLAVDAYDNYEAYMPWNFPLHLAWRRAIAAADVATAAGPQLAARLDRHRKGKPPTVVVPMAADPGFIRRDQRGSREALGLPPGAPLIGYMGGWAANRGTDILLRAFHLVRASRPEARLVVTGRPPERVLREPGVHSLGYIDDAALPVALSAMDVSAVITADTAFGRYSYPAKLCEAMACGVPVVATSTEPVRWMLGSDERFLVPVGDAPALASRMLALLETEPPAHYGVLPSWEDSATRLEAALVSESARSSV